MEEIELVPVEGYTTIGRDPASNAILNTDTTQYEAYIKARNEARKKEKEIKDLKDEVQELKRLVNDLVQKKDK